MTARVTKEWVAQQATKAICPVVEGWKDGALKVFVPGTPANLKNKVGHWSTRRDWAKAWRERTAAALYPHRSSSILHTWPWRSETPKRITFTVYGRSRFDDDNVALVCSPVRDALQDMRLIDNDGNVTHRFVYTQAPPTRKTGAVYGIAIRVEKA